MSPSGMCKLYFNSQQKHALQTFYGRLNKRGNTANTEKTEKR